jgi:hypothetical protein
MKKFLVLSIGLLVAALTASAAEIHGTVSENGKPLAAVAVKLDCAGATAAGKTDEFGSYSLKLAATGECRLSLDYKGASPALKVTVYERPSRYDVAVKEEAGKLVLARK